MPSLVVVARQHRILAEDGIAHVYARGNNHARIFLSRPDRHLYLDLLGQVTEVMTWNTLAYCLMDNHVHLLIETPEANLDRGMQRLHGRYAQAFNARHKRSGHLFGGRYGSRMVTSDRQLAAVHRYIEANPVGAGLCDCEEAWPWSSAGVVSAGRIPDWLAESRLHVLLGTAVG